MDEKEMIVDLLDTVKKQTVTVDKSNKRMFIIVVALITAGLIGFMWT